MEIILELVNEGGLENVGALGSLVQVVTGDIPTANIEIDGGDHGEQFLDWLENILKVAALFVEFETNVSGGTLGEGTVEVSMLFTILGSPGHLLLIGEDTSNEGGTVVATETNEHDSKFGKTGVGGNFLFLNHRLGCLGLLVEESETGLVVDLDVVLVDFLVETGKVGGFLDGSKGEFTFRGRVLDRGLFHSGI